MNVRSSRGFSNRASDACITDFAIFMGRSGVDAPRIQVSHDAKASATS